VKEAPDVHTLEDLHYICPECASPKHEHFGGVDTRFAEEDNASTN